jgi:hypothetical protein
LELISMALGEEPRHPRVRRAADLLAGTIRHQLPITVSRRRYRVPEIPEFPPASESS